MAYACAVVALLLASPAAAATAAPLSVTVDRTEISTQLGHDFVFRSTLTNHGSAAAGGLVAHLNVLSLRPGTYVDPEDWSSNRTRYLPAIPARGSSTLTWTMKAVNAGSFAVYVAVLPQSDPPRPPVTAPAIHVAVADRKTLEAGGILPLALGVPGALGLLLAGGRLWRRHR
jgi:hypothetical protein